MPFKAEVILDSLHPMAKTSLPSEDSGNFERLTTFRLRYPKFIHGELMTHRVFSRNASSARAVPVKTFLEEAADHDQRATFVFWGKNQKGMQAKEELKGAELEYVKHCWNQAALNACMIARRMDEAGAHKQLVNRVLEPFLHINVVVTSTEYMNFFGLRLDADAQPEIRFLADMMWRAYIDSRPRQLAWGEWHLPFIESNDWSATYIAAKGDARAQLELLKMVSTARCARTSYDAFETKKRSEIPSDQTLCEALSQSRHWSPFEHVARPDKLTPDHTRWENPELHGNFSGWIQWRKIFDSEECRLLPEPYLSELRQLKAEVQAG